MEMAVVPRHDRLDDVVQLGEGDVAAHADAAPDRWVAVPQRDAELVDRAGGLAALAADLRFSHRNAPEGRGDAWTGDAPAAGERMNRALARRPGMGERRAVPVIERRGQDVGWGWGWARWSCRRVVCGCSVRVPGRSAPRGRMPPRHSSGADRT